MYKSINPTCKKITFFGIKFTKLGSLLICISKIKLLIEYNKSSKFIEIALRERA